LDDHGDRQPRQARPQNSARGYSDPMGGQARLTAEGIKKQLQEASDRDRDHALAGDDMARAGEELAAAVDRILMPAHCGLPREVVLRAQRESESVDPQALR
jgi:hypothetical protein